MLSAHIDPRHHQLPAVTFDSSGYRRSWRLPLDRLPIRCEDSHDRRDGRHLCADCAGDLRLLLRDLPGLTLDLSLATTKQVTFVEHGVRRDQHGDDKESPLPYNQQASASLRYVLELLGAQGRDYAPVRGIVAYHLWHYDVLLLNPDVTSWALKLSTAALHAIGVIDRPADPWYYGPCPSCGHDIYDERDVDHVRCLQGCQKYAAPAADHQLACLDAGEDRLLTVSELVGAITSAGETVTRSQINGWIRREGLAREQDNRVVWRKGKLVSETVYVYRLGDVRRLAREADDRRAG